MGTEAENTDVFGCVPKKNYLPPFQHGDDLLLTASLRFIRLLGYGYPLPKAPFQCSEFSEDLHFGCYKIFGEFGFVVTFRNLKPSCELQSRLQLTTQ